MRKTRFTEEQIAMALRQGEVGTPVAEIIRSWGSWGSASRRTTGGRGSTAGSECRSSVSSRRSEKRTVD